MLVYFDDQCLRRWSVLCHSLLYFYFCSVLLIHGHEIRLHRILFPYMTSPFRPEWMRWRSILVTYILACLNGLLFRSEFRSLGRNTHCIVYQVSTYTGSKGHLKKSNLWHNTQIVLISFNEHLPPRIGIEWFWGTCSGGRTSQKILVLFSRELTEKNPTASWGLKKPTTSPDLSYMILEFPSLVQLRHIALAELSWVAPRSILVFTARFHGRSPISPRAAWSRRVCPKFSGWGFRYLGNNTRCHRARSVSILPHLPAI